MIGSTLDRRLLSQDQTECSCSYGGRQSVRYGMVAGSRSGMVWWQPVGRLDRAHSRTTHFGHTSPYTRHISQLTQFCHLIKVSRVYSLCQEQWGSETVLGLCPRRKTCKRYYFYLYIFSFCLLKTSARTYRLPRM